MDALHFDSIGREWDSTADHGLADVATRVVDTLNESTSPDNQLQEAFQARFPNYVLIIAPRVSGGMMDTADGKATPYDLQSAPIPPAQEVTADRQSAPITPAPSTSTQPTPARRTSASDPTPISTPISTPSRSAKESPPQTPEGVAQFIEQAGQQLGEIAQTTPESIVGFLQTQLDKLKMEPMSESSSDKSSSETSSASNTSKNPITSSERSGSLPTDPGPSSAGPSSAGPSSARVDALEGTARELQFGPH